MTDGAKHDEQVRPVSDDELLLAKAAVAAGQASDERAALDMFESTRKAWLAAQAEVPPFDPNALLRTAERSSSLGQCVTGLNVGVHGFGHRFEAVIDLTADDARDKVRSAIILEREAEREAEVDALLMDGDDEAVDKLPEVNYDVADQEVNDRLAALEREISRQMFKAEAWFDECCPEMPFGDLRMRAAYDREVVGHGAWEVALDELDRPVRLGYLPGHTVYPLVQTADERTVVVEVERKVSPISTRTFKSERRFTTYVQVDPADPAKKVFFKELGDPRTVSRTTGKAYADDVKETADGETRVLRAGWDKLQAAEGKGAGKAEAIPANAVLFFPVHSPRCASGIPRWIGNLPDILGARAAEETNYTYFDNKSVPVGAWIIENGTLEDDLRQYLEEFIGRTIKNREGFHKSIVIEVQAADGPLGETPRDVRVRWESLQGDQRADAAFLKYNKDARDKTGATFRLPPLLRGEAPSDLTRANSYASLEFANDQVLQPERVSFDWIINKRIMSEIGCGLVRFVSGAPKTTDTELTAKATDVYARHGGLTPADVRRVAVDQLGLALDPISEDWAEQPLPLTLAGMTGGGPDEQVGMALAILNQSLADMGLTARIVPPVEQVPGVVLPQDGPGAAE